MYPNPSSQYSVYQQNDILTLSPVAVIERLYQALERSLNTAKDAVQKGQVAIKGEKLGHALAIIGELQASLDMQQGGDIAENLYDLYSFATHQLLMANIKNDVRMIEDVIRTLQPLSEAWTGIRRESSGRNGSASINQSVEHHGPQEEPVLAAAGY